MLPEQRHERIRTLLANFQHLSTERIAADLGVSRETVRRDVLKLEGMGHLRRVFGGVTTSDDDVEAPIETRAQVRLKEKRRIGRAAAALLRPGNTIFIDAGSTVAAFANELIGLANLTVITNSFDVALKLSSNVQSPDGSAHEVIVLGGRPRAGLQATYGDITVGEIYRYRADYSFVSPVGLHPVNGASSFDRGEAEVARAMCRQSRYVVILADYSKLGQSSRVQFCEMERIDTVITDSKGQKDATFASFRHAGCKLVIA